MIHVSCRAGPAPLDVSGSTGEIAPASSVMLASGFAGDSGEDATEGLSTSESGSTSSSPAKVRYSSQDSSGGGGSMGGLLRQCNICGW